VFTAYSGSAQSCGIAVVGVNTLGCRGALNLNNQSAIGATGLQPGDIFWDGTNLRLCKVAGASVIIV
jgi:hypothetical protein